ncbi:MAG: MFS transporter [Acidimicrobiia bacterium]|nr:MFS transporter [Acidimicrobiia bacterium]
MAIARLLATAFAGFIVFGMPPAALGVAWPSIAADLDRSLPELGVALTVYVGGFFVSSLLTGAIVRRMGLGRALAASGAIGTLAIAGYGASPRWWILLGAAAALGVSGAMIDAGLNAYVALRHTTRVMALLHAGYGVGATLGPLLMTLLLGMNASWRWGYAVLAVGQAAVTISFWRTRDRLNIERLPPDSSARAGKVRPGLTAGLIVFLLYSGIEVGAGQWMFTLLTEARSNSDRAAGLLVTAYWAALTAGRMVLGVAGDRWSHAAMLRLAMGVVVAGLVAVWWDPTFGVGAAGIVLTGLGLSPVFPILMQDTPGRLGASYASTAIGYQLASATVGAAVLPGGLGLLVAWFGLGVIPPVLVAASLAMAAVAAAGKLMAAPVAA